jgi:2-dehydropantoate 2-reductase
VRVAVIGAGGTGGYFGGLLARAGEDVVFVARGPHLEAIQSHGLIVKSRLAGNFTVSARAVEDPRGMGPMDLILFCVKTYSTADAVQKIRSLVGPETMILSIQNGIDSADQIARIVGKKPLLGGAAQVSSVIEAPGVVAQTAGPGKIIFGELDGGPSTRTRRLQETFRRAGITAEVHPDVRVALWEKFIFICGLSGVTTLTRLPIGSILASPETRDFLRGTMGEVEAVTRAEGVSVAAGYVDQTLAFIGRLEPWTRGSLYYDLSAGRRLELDALNGTVVRLGRERKLPTPLNFAIYAALLPYADGAPAHGEDRPPPALG